MFVSHSGQISFLTSLIFYFSTHSGAGIHKSKGDTNMRYIPYKQFKLSIYFMFFIFLPTLPAAQFAAEDTTNSNTGTGKKSPAFEVATIKPAKQSNYSPIGLYVYPGGRIRIGQATLRMMIQYAYDVHDYQIVGGPSWTAQDLFEVQAIPPPDDSVSHQYHPKYINSAPTEEQRFMLQSLLHERFGLRVRHQAKTVSGGILSTAGKTSLMVPSKNNPAWPTFNPGGSTNGRGMSGEGVSMPYLASQLTRFLGFPVVDKTGLIGDYDFHLPDPPEGESPANMLQAQDSIKKNIYDSLPGIGLRLKSAKISVDTIVIIEVNKPSAN